MLPALLRRNRLTLAEANPLRTTSRAKETFYPSLREGEGPAGLRRSYVVNSQLHRNRAPHCTPIILFQSSPLPSRRDHSPRYVPRFHPDDLQT